MKEVNSLNLINKVDNSIMLPIVNSNMLVVNLTANCYLLHMKSTSDMRRFNLCILIDEAGGRTAFTEKPQARDLKIEYGYVGQLVNNSRGIGSSVARKLELIGEKPINWLDHPHYNKWLELKLITEHETPDGIQEPDEDYENKNIDERISNLEKNSTPHNDEIEQLIKKIEFIFSQEDSDKDIEIIESIVDMIFSKNQE